MKYSNYEDLTDRERQIFDFIRVHEGVSKQEIVEAGIAARVTTFGILTKLQEYGMIKTKELNPRFHQVYLNWDNLLTQHYTLLEDFKKHLSILAVKSKQIYDDLVKDEKDMIKRIEYSRILHLPHQLLLEFIAAYNVLTILWYTTIKDKEMLAKLHATVFLELSRLHAELLNIHFKTAGKDYPLVITPLVDLYDKFNLAGSEALKEYEITAKSGGLESETRPILNLYQVLLGPLIKKADLVNAMK